MQRGIASIHRAPREPSRALDWDDARILLAVLRAPSLAVASRAIAVDKSTLSRRIEKLERTLGARLFVRTREGLRPSAVGERLRPIAERIEREVLALTSAATVSGGEVSGLVRIATTEGMAARLVMAGLLDLRAEYPDLELEVLGGNRPVDLSRGEADLAVRVTPTKDADLKVRVLGKFAISLFASPSYLRARGMPRSTKDLAGHDVLVPSGELEMLPEARWLRERPGVRIAFRSSSLPALVEASLRGHGLVALTRAWGDGVAGLEHIGVLETIAARPTWLVMHPDVGKRAAVRVVADRVAAAFRTSARVLVK